ncbi:MAG TPA: helicase HerA-like domain-containing protein [Arenimonas sp.]|uniref:helicase HerA-like domain-containing protein n=1 Tax=Arenimonas sp. TaxID=1872635 RepID=UPI002D7FF676|nr:helicase HerA-like domain-containing protein [Arenimonas sp.]HEU0152636.1 helicase HerA-like domain-containing protein [Arenimonas sp.]
MSDILIGKGDLPVRLMGKYGNRHGLVAGATGTGKSVTLMVMAEGFSRLGVPVVMADVKGDIAGLAVAGTPSEKLAARVAQIGVEGYTQEASPVVFWDLYGKLGHPLRTTVSEVGPALMSRMLELNDTQSGVMDIAFKLADDNGLLLLDLDDLRALLNFVTENKADISKKYGLVSPQSVAAIQRSLLRLEQDGGKQFFGEPAVQLADLMRQDMSGRGVINLLAADQLILRPRLYSSFLLWLLSELFETLPEVGDLDVPKLVFFFDEAHLLFDDCPPALQQRVEQVVRLIRSKGVGVYFCSQNPDDIPDTVLGQLGNRVQHALRAYTPRDQKAVRTAAETFVQNPRLDVAKVIGELGVGEALVSMLLEKGIPMPVERALIAPPRCRMGAITDEERATVRGRSPVGGKYDTPVNRESAFEMLAKRAEQAAAPESPAPGPGAPAPKAEPEPPSKFDEFLWGTKRRQGAVEAAAKSATRTVANGIGRQILRGILGSLMGGKKR